MVEFSGLREKKTLCFKIRWCLNVVGLSCVSWLLVDMGEARFVSWEGFPSVHKAFTKGSISLLCSMTVWMSQALSMENLSIGFDYSAFIGHFFIWEFLSYAYCEILIDNTKVIVGHVTGAVFVRSWLWFWLLLMCGSLSPQALTLLLLMRSARFWSFSVLTLLRLSLVPGKLAVLSLPWMRQCSLHNCSSVVISIMFSFLSSVNNVISFAVVPGVICEGAKRTMRNWLFLKNTRWEGLGISSCSTLCQSICWNSQAS